MNRRRPKTKPQTPKAEDLGLDTFQEPTIIDGLSLDSLEVAEGAEAVRIAGADPYSPVPQSESTLSPLPLDLPVTTSTSDDCEICPRTILEAMLFVGGAHQAPLTATQVAGLMRGVRPQEIDQLVGELNATYDAEGCPYRIESVGDGYRMTLREEFAPLRDRFLGRNRGTRLSQAAVDVLAIVAYRQPIDRETIERLRGKPSGAILRQLVRRQLLRIERSNDAAAPPSYHTTPRFLELFHLSDISELPYSQEVGK